MSGIRTDRAGAARHHLAAGGGICLAGCDRAILKVISCTAKNADFSLNGVGSVRVDGVVRGSYTPAPQFVVHALP